MRIAIIDLGTNTFNFLIVETRNGRNWKELYKTQTPVKLGEGGINLQIIQPAAFVRGIEAMKKFKEEMIEKEVKRVKSIATSAIRSAKNGNDFIKRVQDETGIKIDVIDGDREAELIYKGVKLALEMGHDLSLIMDIGGGSVEFIICNRETIFWKKSFNVGAARLAERFHKQDPITQDNLEKLFDYLEQELQALFQALKKFPVKSLIGSSGSFDSFAEMALHRFGNPSSLDGRTSYEFNLNQFDHIYAYLLNSTQEERLKIPGLIDFRADMIVIAAAMTEFILKSLGIERMLLSTYALKEGVLAEMLE